MPMRKIWSFPTEKLDDGFRAGLHMQFLVNQMQMPAHDVQSDAQLIADLLVEKTLRLQRQNLQLTPRQVF
jgi:hypothetical protein